MSTFDSPPPEVFVVGSASIDLVTYSANLPQPGETIFGTAFEKHFGGKGANQAVQCAQLGLRVGMCGRVGSDAWGREYIDNMGAHRIDTTHFCRGTHNTGIASIFVAESGANCIVIVPGSNSEVTADAVLEASDSIRDSLVMVCQNEIPIEATFMAMQLARKSHTLSILNPAPASESVLPLIDLCDIVCPNETELSTLTSLPANSIDEILTAARQLLSSSSNCKVIIVTLGERGAMIVAPSGYAHLPTEKVTAVDTVGAGDSFIGSLVSRSLYKCM
jgi:ribokinase